MESLLLKVVSYTVFLSKLWFVIGYQCRSLLDLQPDVVHQPIIGPALRVGGHLFAWQGPPPSSSTTLPLSSKLAAQSRATRSESYLNLTSMAQLTSTASLSDLPSPVASQLQLEFQENCVFQLPIQLRVNFEAKPDEMTTSVLEMENCGTAAVYYSWQVSKHVHTHMLILILFMFFACMSLHVSVDAKVQPTRNNPGWKHKEVLF